jgi:hypothetical protein
MSRWLELSDWLMHRVGPMFEQRVPPISEDVMFKWGQRFPASCPWSFDQIMDEDFWPGPC